MRAASSYFARFRQPYRPAWEFRSSAVWALGAAYFLALNRLDVIRDSFASILAGFCLAFFFWRLAEGWFVIRARSYLHGWCVGFLSMQELAGLTRQNEIWLGRGFVWEPEHSQKLYDLSKIGFKRWRLGALPLLLSLRGNEVQPDSDQGLAALHGLNRGEYDLYRPFKNFEGGTALVGTTQAGKGVMLNVLISQAILRDEVVIIFDPKGSVRLWRSVCTACKVAGRPAPDYFTTEADKDGVRLNPFHTWNSSGEIASRVVSVMSPSSDDSFRAFAWAAVDTVAQALIDLGYQPLLRMVEYHINMGIDELLGLLLDKHLKEFGPGDDSWRRKAREAMPVLKNPTPKQDELRLKVSWYENVMPREYQSRTIESALKVHHHSQDHYAKITASLMPCFALLNNGDLQRILSPDPLDIKDNRPILNMEDIISKHGVLYISMGSLQNADVASAVGAIFLADLAAVAGKRYQLRKNDTRIAIFVDEVSNVLNVPLIEILNKGAEGGMYTTCAMQTLADLEERMRSKAAARKVIGNLNNVIALRTKDGETRDVFTETLGKTYISHVDTSISTHSENISGIPSYNAGASHKKTSKREDIIPGEFFSMLPNCQYFAMVSAGLVLKGRVPILFDEDDFREKPSTKQKAKLTSEEEIKRALQDLESGAPENEPTKEGAKDEQ